MKLGKERLREQRISKRLHPSCFSLSHCFVFLESVVKPANILENEVRSLHALALIHACVKDGKFGRDIGSTAAGLNRMFADHTRAFTAAYPTSGIIPKGHWGFHLASQLLRDGYSIDCYVGERQNCILKQCAESVKNTQAFETSVLTRILGDRLAALSNVDFFLDRLNNPNACPTLAQAVGVDTALLSASMKYRGTPLVTGDAIWCDHTICMIAGCAQLDSTYAIICDKMVLIEQVSMAASRWRYSSTREYSVFRLHDHEVSLPAAFFWEGDTVVVLAW